MVDGDKWAGLMLEIKEARRADESNGNEEEEEERKRCELYTIGISDQL